MPKRTNLKKVPKNPPVPGLNAIELRLLPLESQIFFRHLPDQLKLPPHEKI